MGYSTMAVMDRSGDTEIKWDKDKPDEVDVARTAFNSLKKKGYIAYVLKKLGGRGKVISEFDPNAGRIVMAPMSAGG